MHSIMKSFMRGQPPYLHVLICFNEFVADAVNSNDDSQVCSAVSQPKRERVG